jgi:hypothetical protein
MASPAHPLSWILTLVFEVPGNYEGRESNKRRGVGRREERKEE